ncbi:unnamed protein product [Caenorhabditis nigoni]
MRAHWIQLGVTCQDVSMASNSSLVEQTDPSVLLGQIIDELITFVNLLKTNISDDYSDEHVLEDHGHAAGNNSFTGDSTSSHSIYPQLHEAVGGRSPPCPGPERSDYNLKDSPVGQHVQMSTVPKIMTSEADFASRPGRDVSLVVLMNQIHNLAFHWIVNQKSGNPSCTLSKGLKIGVPVLTLRVFDLLFSSPMIAWLKSNWFGWSSFESWTNEWYVVDVPGTCGMFLRLSKEIRRTSRSISLGHLMGCN